MRKDRRIVRTPADFHREAPASAPLPAPVPDDLPARLEAEADLWKGRAISAGYEEELIYLGRAWGLMRAVTLMRAEADDLEC